MPRTSKKGGRVKRLRSDDSSPSQVERDVEAMSEANESSDDEGSLKNTENPDSPPPRIVDAKTKRRSPQEEISESLQRLRYDSGSDKSSTQSFVQTSAGLLMKAKVTGRGSRSQREKSQRARSEARKRGSSESGRDSLDSLNSTDHSVALYEAILNARLDLGELVGCWIEKYKKDKDVALLSLQQLFVSSSGCSGVLTPEMRELEHTELIRQLSPKFDPRIADYPLIMSGQKWQSFRDRLGDFVQLIVDQCRNSIIYDQELLADTTSFLISLTDSQIRDFRHTATFVAMKLATALVKVAYSVTRNLGNARRQLEAERLKSRTSERIEALAAKVEELEENSTELTEYLSSLYSSVFVHRYVDVASDIRAICMVEMGRWMEILPEVYVNDKYLKYIGWNLSDRAVEVRFECLLSLLPLYAASATLKPKLEGFTSTFKPRIVAMVRDEDPEVAVEAIRLVTLILADYAEFLDDADCERVFELVYSTDRGVARAAGAFLRQRLFKLDEDAPIARSRRGKPRPPNAPLVRDLVVFFHESELHEHAAYLVDALVDTNPMVKDWECMIDLLIEDAGQEEESLSNEAETCLIEIMVSSVRLAATGEIPVGRTPARKFHSKSDLKQIASERRKLTEHFIPALSRLLEKYRADPAKLANLLKLPQYFDLSLYSTLREEQSLDSLLRGINEIALRSFDAPVLEVAAKTLEILSAADSPIVAQCEVSLSMLLDALVDGYKRATIERKIATARNPEEAIFAVAQALKKVAIFYSTHDLNAWNIRKALLLELEDTNDFPAEAVVDCIAACRQSILWCRRNLANPEEDATTQPEIVARQLGRDLDVFVETIRRFVEGGGNEGRNVTTTDLAIREEAYETICDLLVVFNARLPEDEGDLLRQLVYPVDENLQTLLIRFVQERIFRIEETAKRGEDERIEELHKRRKLLAGYCKLVIYNVLPARSAADIFKHYASFYNDHGDVIKLTILRTMRINSVNCALTMLLSLKSLFLEIREARRESDEFKAIKELARKFAPLFVSQSKLHRDAVVALHLAGTLFAADAANSSETPANLLFFEVLQEFSRKIHKDDKRVVLDHLNSIAQALVPSTPGKEWKPLILYRSSLMSGNAGIANRRNDNRQEGDAGNADVGRSDRETKSKKEKRVSKKNPLQVTKVTFARGSRSSVHENDDLLSSTSDSPLPMIHDSSENTRQDEESGLMDSPQMQRENDEAQPDGVRRSSRKRSSPVLYEDEY